MAFGHPTLAGRALALLAASLLVALAPIAMRAGTDPCEGTGDTDGDGVCDRLDNCITRWNPGPSGCDTDQDGYGNACDGDFDNGGTVNALDFKDFFVPDFQAGIDSGVGTDMDCAGTSAAGDFNNYFIPQFQAGLPGPSGWTCAGTVPCLAP